MENLIHENDKRSHSDLRLKSYRFKSNQDVVGELKELRLLLIVQYVKSFKKKIQQLKQSSQTFVRSIFDINDYCGSILAKCSNNTAI